jgi:putative addiction module CopG family antidote
MGGAVEVAIPKSLEALVRRKVDEGHYSTEAEVVADALRLMKVRDELTALKHDRLRDALERGYEDVAAGRVIQLETEDEIDALFAGL